MTIKFNNNESLNYKEALETEEFYDNALRRTLSVDFDVTDVDFQTLQALSATSDNLQLLELYENEQSKTILDDYSIRIALILHEKNGTDTITLKLGKLTYIEKQLELLGIQRN